MSHAAILLAGAAAVFFAALMLVQRSLYACAVCLLAVLLQTAAVFFFLGASMVAFLQVMIYAGAVMVLVVITVMAAPTGNPIPSPRHSMLFRILAAVGILAPMAEAGAALFEGKLPAGVAWGAATAQAGIGPILFGPYAVATEAVGFLIFLSALAVADLSRRES
ncbi:MAG: NADH-quinone oxidoreductase subunit J family protein [Elusimicrobiota bacterium]